MDPSEHNESVVDMGKGDDMKEGVGGGRAGGDMKLQRPSGSLHNSYNLFAPSHTRT